MCHVYDLVSVVARCFKSPDSVAEQPTTSKAKAFKFQNFKSKSLKFQSDRIDDSVLPFFVVQVA
jgi:hypothetical protein